MLQQLSQAVAQFFLATQEVGTCQGTVTFTASEFGRTLQPNTDAGTDHAWGNHHFPTTSVDQYAATLAEWFGLSSGGASQLFQHVGNFATSNLEFLA